jgi:hypothetical protein
VTGQEHLWAVLNRTPRSEADVREAAQAAAALLPPAVTLPASGTTVTFCLGRGRYWADLAGLIQEERGALFCLTWFRAYLLEPRWIRESMPPALPPLTEQFRSQWDAPEHRVIRRLLAVHGYARTHLRVPVDPLDEQRVAPLCRGLNTALCRLAAARLEGRAHTVASALAATWPGTPHELTRTAEAICLQPGSGL